MFQVLQQLWKDEEAPTAAEYAVLATLVAVAIAVVVAALGQGVDSLFQDAVAKFPG